MTRFFCFCFSALCLLTLLSCQSEVNQRNWHSLTLFTMDSKIQTVAFGPLWEDEIPCLALAAADGRCVVLWEQERAWRHRELHRVPGGLSAVAIGDADPGTPGPDLFVGTGGGQVLRIFVTREGDVLVRLIHEAESPVADLAVFDLDPHSPGREILLLTEGGHATVLAQPSGGEDMEYGLQLGDIAYLRQ